MIKRTIVAAVVLGLVAGSMAIPAEAGKKKRKKTKRVERVVEYSYRSPSPGAAGVVGACLSVLAPELESGCVDIPTSGDELYASVIVADTAGGKPHVILAQDTDSNSPGLEIFADFCGETSDPVPITPGLPLRVSVYAGSSQCPSPGTSGVITTTLSNLP